MSVVGVTLCSAIDKRSGRFTVTLYIPDSIKSFFIRKCIFTFFSSYSSPVYSISSIVPAPLTCVTEISLLFSLNTVLFPSGVYFADAVCI